MKLLNTIIFTLVSVFLLMGSSLTKVKRYQADMFEAKWNATENPLLCEITHDIPLYGSARFYQKSGETLQFELNIIHQANKVSSGFINSSPPLWKAKLDSSELGRVNINPGPIAISLQNDQAMLLLNELEQGMKPNVQYRDWFNGEYVVKVALSPVNFSEKLNDFRQCITKLHPLSFDKIQLTNIFFNVDDDTVPSQYISKIKDTSEYIAKDPSVIKVIVSAFASKKGDQCYNRDLSEFRAENLRDVLIEAGIDKNIIEVIAVGKNNQLSHEEESFSFKSEGKRTSNNETDNSLERRVTIELIKSELTRK